MQIYEYQAKEILRFYGVPIVPGLPVRSKAEALTACKELGGDRWVVKAQIYAGGRGKAGGIIMAKGLLEVEAAVDKLLGQTLITSQTGAAGQMVDCLYIEQPALIDQEFYLSLLIKSGRLTLVTCAQGGVDIEAVARENPHAIVTQSLDPLWGLAPFHGRRMGFERSNPADLEHLLQGLYRAFLAKDASLLEINPLVLTTEGSLLALDAKMALDDNALFRQPEIAALRHEVADGINYVRLKGTIGCMVNGAGLAMATMDLIHLYGMEPANFLDVGGNADQTRISSAFKIIVSDPNVKAVFINIFGGILRCDVIAEGIIAAAHELSLSLPLVVRLQGTNAELGKQILQASSLPIVAAESLQEATLKVMQAAIGC